MLTSEEESALELEGNAPNRHALLPPTEHMEAEPPSDRSSTVLLSDSITIRKIITCYARDSGPFIFAGSIGAFTHFISSLLLSRLGEEMLAASPLMLLSESLIDSFAMFLLSGMTVKIAENSSAEESHKVGEIFRQGILLALFLSIPAVSFALFADKIMLLIGQEESLAQDVGKFFKAYAPGMPALMLMNAQITTLVGLRHTKPALAVTILQFAVTGGLGYAIILGNFGFQEMGIVGFGITRSIAAWLSSIGLFLYLRFKPGYRHYQFFNRQLRGTFHWLKEIVKIGGPLAVLAPTEQAGRLLSIIIIGLLGKEALAAEQVVIQTISLLMAFYITGQTIMSAHVATAIGRDKYKNARLIGNTEIVSSTLISVTGALTFALMPTTLARLFISDIDSSKNEKLASQISWLFAIQGVNLVFETVRQLSLGALKGTSDTLDSMLIGVLNTAIWLSVGYIIVETQEENRLNYFFLAQTITAFLSMVPLLLKWRKVSNNAVREERVAEPVSMFKSAFSSVTSFFGRCRNCVVGETSDAPLENNRLLDESLSHGSVKK